MAMIPQVGFLMIPGGFQQDEGQSLYDPNKVMEAPAHGVGNPQDVDGVLVDAVPELQAEGVLADLVEEHCTP